MKTLAVNTTTNFKALYQSENANFTKAQRKTVDNIALKISQKPFDTTNFYVEPRKNDFVELYVLDENSTNLSNSKKKDSIGQFNEAYPFEKDSYTLKKAQFWNNKSGTIATAVMLGSVITMLLGLASFIKNKSTITQNIEKVVTTTADSLNNRTSKNIIDLLK